MHFSEEMWSDFIRGVAAEPRRREIERHLEEGCRECIAQQATWQTVFQAAQAEPGYTPPADLVRRIAQEFAIRRPQRETLWARLTFDTFAQPLTAGVRSGRVSARQVLYEAGGIAVDLRLEAMPGTDQVCAVGQVQDRSSRTFVRPHLPVSLLNDSGETLMKVVTNDFGEFQFEFGRRGVARVSIEIDAARTIVIPLSDLEGYWQKSN